MKAYVVQVRKGTYLTDKFRTTTNLQQCMWLKDRTTAELYATDKDRDGRVVEVYIRKEQGQWVAYKE